jgi:hypothetical protein
MLLRVMVKPTWSPTVTLAASAVLRTATSGQRTSMVAVDVLFNSSSASSLLAETVAVLESVPQSSASVVPTM